MPSVTWSFKGLFSPALLKKNAKRFWPLWGIYGLGLFLLLPAPLLSSIYLYIDRGGSYISMAAPGGELRSFVAAAPIVGFLYGILCAMALFHFLMDHKATQMLHALPIRREGLFLTNGLSGLLFILVPNLIVALITLFSGLGAQAMGLVLDDRFLLNLALGLGAQTAIPMFFFCFGVCCAMFTGNLLALPVFYGILNILVLGLFSLVADWLLPHLLAGYCGSVPEWCRWFTPVLHLQILVEQGTGYGVLEAICYCLVAGCAFTLIALGVYRLRQLERAGDLVTVGWVRPVFQYGFGLCVGLTMGIFVWRQILHGDSTRALLTLIVLFAALGAFAGRMLLKKTLQVFDDGWKGVAVMAVVLTLLLVGIRADFFGYQRWVPKPEQVESVYLNIDSYPWDDGNRLERDITDPALIERVTAIHADLVSDLSRIAPDAPAIHNEWNERGEETRRSTWLRLRYAMENGEVIERYYDDVPLLQSELETESTYAHRLETLINQPELVQWAYFDDCDPTKAEVVDGWLENLRPAESTQDVSAEFKLNAGDSTSPQTETATVLVGADTDRSTSYVLTTDQARQLWAAVWEDLQAGRIGRRYLLDNAQRQENCYYTDIYLSLAYTQVDEEGRRISRTTTVSITVQASADATLKTLEELGLKDRLSRRETLRG